MAAVCHDDVLAGLQVEWSSSAGADSFELLRDGAVVARLTQADTRAVDEFAGAVPAEVVYEVVAIGRGGRTVTDQVRIETGQLTCGDVIVPEPDPEPGEPEPGEPDPADPLGALTAAQVCHSGAPAIRLSWSAVPGATNYRVLRDGAELSQLTRTSYLDDSVTVDLEYEYTVSVTGSFGESVSPALLVTVADACIATTGTVIASYDRTNLAIDTDGYVWAWGANEAGLLGTGNTNESTVPVRVAVISDVVSVAIGYDFALALNSSGQVWSWGSNWDGELGQPGISEQYVPLAVAGLNDVVSIAAGDGHALALTSDGSVWTWGRNGSGQLGQGDGIPGSSVPLRIEGLSNVVAVSAGSSSSFAIHSDGTVSAWGRNSSGQLGLGDSAASLEPRVVADLASVKDVSSGSSHTLFLLDDGSVLGAGTGYLLGLSGSTQTPVALPLQGPASSVYASEALSFAVLDTGELHAWGDNYSFALPWAERDDLEPAPVPGISGAVAVTAGLSHVVVLDRNGAVYGWGLNDYYQLVPTSQRVHFDFVPVDYNGLIQDISMGDRHGLLIDTDGAVWSWGDNLWGQLGTGAAFSQSTPVRIEGLSDVTQVSAGFQFSLAVDDQGRAWAWGLNSRDQLGTGSPAPERTPVQIGGLADVTMVSAGSDYGLALDSSGRVWSWGANGTGQLGLGLDDYARQAVPLQVDLQGEAAVAVSAGYNHSLITMADGSVRAFGANSNGQLGTGGSAASRVPVTPAVTDVAQAFAGDGASFVIHHDGTMSVWGANRRLGAGTGTGNQYTPVPLTGISDVQSLSTSRDHTLAITGSGALYTWGRNYSGQMGLPYPTTSGFSTPQQLGASGYSLAVTSDDSSLIVRDGQLLGAGSDRYGQLGQGRLYRISEPTQLDGSPLPVLQTP